MFSEGQLKERGLREEPCRQKKRPHQALLAPSNHFLPGVFILDGPIENEDGELTDIEVQSLQKLLPVASYHLNKTELSWHLTIVRHPSGCKVSS